MDVLKLFLFSLMLGAIGAALVHYQYRTNTEAAAFADHGRKAMAVARRLEWKQEKSGGNAQAFKVDVYFVDEAGNTVTSKVSINEGIANGLRQQKDTPTLPIAYLPENPGPSAVYDRYVPQRGMLGYLGGAALLLAAVVTFFKTVRSVTSG